MAGMGWRDQVLPPLVVATTAAPFGEPAAPTVDPTAQHRALSTQSSASRELTGGGRVTVTRLPCQGDPGAMVDGAPEPPVDGEVEQATASSAATATENSCCH